MNKEELDVIIKKHEDLRNILINYKCEEHGDCIIDDICNLFNYPTTILYYEDDDVEDLDDEDLKSQYFILKREMECRKLNKEVEE